MDFRERKRLRTEKYNESVGLKLRSCSACNGSGHYDSRGAPKCAACKGTGKERYKFIEIDKPAK